MNDKLQDILADLANGLGISVNQLWDWLQGNGLSSYTKVMVAQSIYTVIACIFLFVVTCLITYRLYKWYMTEKEIRQSSFDEDTAFILSLFSGVFAIVMIGVTLVNTYYLIGWLTSSEGMIIKMFLDKLS